MAKEIWRDYVIRKYVRARDVQEALRLAESAPVIEVNEQQANPEPSIGGITRAAGFYQPSED
jgi:hypothetical protein